MALLTASLSRRPLPALLPWLLLLHPHPRPLRLLPPLPPPPAAPPPAAPAAPAAAGAVEVKAPMPGNILDVKVAAGASVKAGDVLVILEAMKMENEIVAPQDGTVASINVHKGDTVNSGDTLVSMN